MVIRELLEIGRNKLITMEYGDPLKEAIYILSKVLNKDRSFVYINLDKFIDSKEENEYLDIINRRSLGEPISYIFSSKEFMGIDFWVEKGVLIPRPETEILVEYLIDYIKNNFKEEKLSLLDIGIGSGAISLSVAKKCKNTDILGIDISKTALRVAQENLGKLNLTNVEFRESNLFQNIKIDEKFSVIVSNPPYIETDVIKDLQIDVKDFEPSLALDGGADGLDFYREISRQAGYYLRDKGMLIYEIGYDQGEKVRDIMRQEGFKEIKIIRDLNDLDRIVLGFK